MTSRFPLFAWLATLVLVLTAAFVTDRVTPVAHAQQDQAQQQDTRSTETEALLQSEQNTIQIVERYGDSVVSINVEVSGQRVDPFEGIPDEQIPPFFRQLPQQQQPPMRGSGSGFVINEDGQIVTNFHVVASALDDGSTELLDGASITVVFPSQTNIELDARVVGGNALYDLALLELEDPDRMPAEVTPIPIADSDEIRVGQKTIAIGNPFGFESTVTTGIVSALGRNLPLTDAIIPLIQTDAAINPGNSGGPLLNSNGELIGINTAIYPAITATGQRGFLGIGFAVPSNILRANLDQLQAGGIEDLSTRPRLGIGIESMREYPEAVRERLDLPEQGVAVLSVAPGSAAEEAGIREPEFQVQVNGQTIPVPTDVIVAVNGEEITSLGQLQSMIFSMNAGDVAELTILRNGEEITVPVELRVVPSEEPGQDQEQDQEQEQEQN
ncbi:MAG TPA: trypsin-like peptidase domain-containing protein [Trueperaceae bacterium]